MTSKFFSKFSNKQQGPDRRSTDAPSARSQLHPTRPPVPRSQSTYSDSGSFLSGGSSEGHPNVTVIPPSPNNSVVPPQFSFPADDELRAHQRGHTDSDGYEGFHRRTEGGVERRSKSMSLAEGSPILQEFEEALPTPTPASVKAAASTGNLRGLAEQAGFNDTTPRIVTHPATSEIKRPSSSGGAGASSVKHRRSSTDSSLGLNLGFTPMQGRDRAGSNASMGMASDGGEGVAMSPVVESPTAIRNEIGQPLSTTTSNGSASGAPASSAFLTPRRKQDADAASIVSASTGKKRRPWGKSNPSSPASQPANLPSSPKGKGKDLKPGAGLAGALAASGLAMANPGTTYQLPDMSTSSSSSSNKDKDRDRSKSVSEKDKTDLLSNPRPKPIRSTSATSLTPIKTSRSKSDLLAANGSSERNGRDRSRARSKSRARSREPSASRHNSDPSDTLPAPPPPRSNLSSDGEFETDEGGSFVESNEDEESESDDELGLDDDDIPVTGFAVASNKRNADFHDLFPSIPEGDYLIDDYGCALQREILIQGRLYISENHVCFHANIFGWITDLCIPMYEITSLEKKMTAFVIPNAIQISTRAAKYNFASFLSRDTTFDVIYNIWRLARPDESDIGSRPSARPSLEADGMPGDINGVGTKVAAASGPVRKATQCACSKDGSHYPEVAMDITLPGTPEKIYNLVFASGFIKDFLREDQKLLDIQISDWQPMESDSKCLARNMSYIKPLAGGLGPKQTKCELRDETVHCDFDDYVTTVTTTRTPDVPSGNVFSVKTRTCIMWATSISARIIVTTEVQWTGRSFIKGIIEKSCIEGQKTYHDELERAMRNYIAENKAEFIPEGIDEAAAAEEEQLLNSPVSSSPPPQFSATVQDARKARTHERNQRSLQWAWDTFDGAYNVGTQSARGAIELIKDAWDQSSTTTILYGVIVILVISNIWTLMVVGKREEVGRRKELLRGEDREKWVQAAVSGLWEELLLANRNVPVVRAPADWKEEVEDIHKALDGVEQRVQALRTSLKDLD